MAKNLTSINIVAAQLPSLKFQGDGVMPRITDESGTPLCHWNPTTQIYERAVGGPASLSTTSIVALLQSLPTVPGSSGTLWNNAGTFALAP